MVLFFLFYFDSGILTCVYAFLCAKTKIDCKFENSERLLKKIELKI